MTIIDTAPQTPAEAARHLRDDGFLLLRGLLPAADLTAVASVLERAGDRLIARWRREGLLDHDFAEVPWQQRLHRAVAAVGDEAERPRVLRSWREQLVSPALFALQGHPALRTVLQALGKGEVFGHEAFNARPKLPGSAMQVVPWHQDHGYYGEADREESILTTWIPLVPVDHANGCMQVIGGSHRGGPLRHATGDNAAGFLEIPDGVDETGMVTCEMEPGDVLIMHPLLLHRSTPNVSDTIRWSVDLRYVCGDSPRRSERPWVIASRDRAPTDLATWYAWQYDLHVHGG